MADILTRLEDRLEEHYNECKDAISDSRTVASWDDFNHRSGYLAAIRKVGLFIKEVRNPELPRETGEIPNIIEQEEVSIHG